MEQENGIVHEEFESFGIPVSRVHVQTEADAVLLGKPCGTYTTIETGPLDQLINMENSCNCLAEQLKEYLQPYFGKPLLVCGVGNPDIAADSYGPRTAKLLFPHMQTANLLCNFSKMGVISPDVKLRTNLPTETIVSGVASAMDVGCVLTVDACITKNFDRLCSTIQMSDTGMVGYLETTTLQSPTVNCPVISVAVPTSIHLSNLRTGEKNPDVLLTPVGVDDSVKTAALITACAIMMTACPKLDFEQYLQFIAMISHGVL